MIILFLLLLLPACVPSFGGSFELSEEELRSSDNPVWTVGFESIETASAALRAFDPAMGRIEVSEVGSDTFIRRIRELESPWLDRNRIMIMLAFWGDKMVLVFVDLSNRSGTLEVGSLAERLRSKLIEALDARYGRGVL